MKPDNFCTNLELFREYLLGLQTELRAQIEAHVDNCELCAEILDLMEFRMMAELFPRTLTPSSDKTGEISDLLSRLRDLPQELN